MGKCWQKFKTCFALLLSITDVVTDIATLDYYYATQAVSVMVLATASLVFSMIPAILIIFFATMLLFSCAGLEVSECARKKEKSIKDFLIFLRILEANIESIPQFIINIYVSSLSCANVTEPKRNFTQTVLTSTSTSLEDENILRIPLIQLISGIISGIVICLAILNFDKWEVWNSEDEEEPSVGSRTGSDNSVNDREGENENDAILNDENGGDEAEINNRRKAQNGENDGSNKRLKEKHQYDWLEKYLLIATKACGVTARIQIVAFAAFYLGWCTSVLFAVHLVIMVPLMRKIAGDKCYGKCEDSTDVKYLLFSLVAPHFTWLLDTWEKWVAVTCSMIYSVENVILLVVVHFCFKSTPYCLYSNATEVNVWLNLACVVFAVLFYLKRFGNFQALNENVERIGDCAENYKRQLKTLLCKCNEDRSKDEMMTEQSISGEIDEHAQSSHATSHETSTI